ncbi:MULTISPECIES: hypothetical protein [unclassified Streptomyces]|nr:MULTISPECIES: hypothetical protein [unclassified Streptomyces]
MPRRAALTGIATTGAGTGLLISFVAGNVETAYVWPPASHSPHSA